MIWSGTDRIWDEWGWDFLEMVGAGAVYRVFAPILLLKVVGVPLLSAGA